MNRIQQLQQRYWARRFALQALYQWQLTGHGVDELLAQYATDENWTKVDADYFTELLRESINNINTLTARITEHATLPVARIDPVEHAILLYSTYEMLHKSDLPTEVIISEAVKLCKKFGALEGYKFVNGVLDKIAAQRGQ